MIAFTNAKTSLAAERALDAGEEVEDTLWVGSGRFDGAAVRRQLAQHKSIRAGSQHLLQSMKFWESLRFGGGGRRNSSDDARDSSGRRELEYPTTPTTPSTSNHGRGVGHRMRSLFQHHHDLAQNLVDGCPLQRDHYQLQRANQLLSMRCEASRSMRRQRGGGNQLMQWVMDETKSPIQTMQATTKFGFPFFGHNNDRQQVLQRKNLELMEQQQQEQNNYLQTGIPTYSSDDNGLDTSEQGDQADTSLRSSHNNTYQSTGSTQPPLQPRKSQTKPKKKKRKWRLWLPHRKEPIDLVHPASSQDSEGSSTLSSNMVYRGHSKLPADVQLKQQLAKAQKRRTVNRGSRHLESQLENSTTFNSNSGNFRQPSEEFSNFDSTNHPPPSSTYSSFRSTRNDVHSNQPLLIKQTRTKGLSSVAGGSNIGQSILDDDEHTIRSGQHNNNNPLRKQQSSSYVPRHVQMHLPHSRGSILVQQISGLSIDTIARSLDTSTPQEGGTMITMPKSLIAMSTGSAETDEETIHDDDDDDDDNADSNNYYSVQELLNSSNKLETRRTTHHDAVLTSHKRRSFAKRQNGQKQDPEGTRFRYWFETDDDDDDDHASHDGSHDSGSFVPGTHRVFPQNNKGMVRLECLEEVEEESEHMDESMRSSRPASKGRGVDPSFGSSFYGLDDDPSNLLDIPKVRKHSNTSSTAGRFGSLFSKSATSQSSSLFSNSNNKLSTTPSQSSIYVPPRNNTNNNKKHDPPRRQSIDAPTWDPNGPDEEEHVQDGKRDSNTSDVSQLTTHLDLSQTSLSPPRLSSVPKITEGRGDSQSSLDISGLEDDSQNNRNAASMSSLEYNHGNNSRPRDKAAAAAFARNSASMSELDNHRRRQSLPALGARQQGIRGGILAECAQEALLDASRREEEELREIARKAAKKAPLRRTQTAPEPRRIVSMEDEVDTKKTAIQSYDWWKDPPGSTAEDTEKNFEILWKGTGVDAPATDAPTASETPDTTNSASDAIAEAWCNLKEDYDDEMDSKSFGSNLYVVWDQQGKEDPYIVVSEGPSFDSMGLTSDHHHYHDTRSVVSEPAHMGMFDDSFHTTDDMDENKKWLMAWDDLALL
ncbi:expressed unknown protein [Seminavis robusta]|uniref:Uncharacterized protein n=1 Tax=Seminavis robusta TaxID=568900 RepID=A0A9N8EXM3_9STRA|nr:expressed unknown protein [Seminavis robusta]|eukprot:Sro2717_g335410.1 n/a (1098) ;mRNA; r:6880-10173